MPVTVTQALRQQAGPTRRDSRKDTPIGKLPRCLVTLPGHLLGLGVPLHNLLLEHLLVADDVALPLGDGLFLADPDLLGHLRSDGERGQTVGAVRR